MLLYNVSQNNRLSKVKNISFTDTGVYIVDDYKNLYLWCGKKASKKKKDFGIKKVNLLNEKRESPANTHVLNQGQEFGAFLAIFDLLKKGLKQNSTVERRPELDLKIEDTLELIEAGIDPDFEGEITIDAHKISQKKKTLRGFMSRTCYNTIGAYKRGKKAYRRRDQEEIRGDLQFILYI